MSHYSTIAPPPTSPRDFSSAQLQPQASLPGNILNFVAPVDNSSHVLSPLHAVQLIPQYHQPYGAPITGSYAYYQHQQPYTAILPAQQAATSAGVYGAIPGVIPGPTSPPTHFVAVQSVPNAPSPVHAEPPAPPTATPTLSGAGSNSRQRGKNTVLRLYDALEDPDMKDAIEWYEDDDEGHYGFQIPDTRPPKFDKVLRKHFSGTSDTGIKFSSFERNVKNQGFRRLSPKGATDVIWIHDSQEFYQGNRQNSELVRAAAAAASRQSQHQQSAQDTSTSPAQPAILEAIAKELKSSMQKFDGRMMASMQQLEGRMMNSMQKFDGRMMASMQQLEGRMMNSMQEFEGRMMQLVAKLDAEVMELKAVNKNLALVNEKLVKKIESLELTNNEPNTTSAKPLNSTQSQHAQVPGGGVAKEPDRHDPVPADLSLVHFSGSAVVEDASSGGGPYSYVTFEAHPAPRTQISGTSPRRMASVATVDSRHLAQSRTPYIDCVSYVFPPNATCATSTSRNPGFSAGTIHSSTPVYVTASQSSSSTRSEDRPMSWVTG